MFDGAAASLPAWGSFCNAPRGLHPNGSFSRDSQVGVPKLSRNCPGWSPGILSAHNSRLQSLIATRSELKLYPSSRSFQRHVALSIRRSGRGRLPTFSNLLLPITWAGDVQMTNARPFSISALQDLSNDTKNTSMRGVLGLAFEL